MKRSTTLTTLAVASALALAGCGPDSSEQDTGTGAETTAPATAAPTTSAPEATGTVSASGEPIAEEHNDADVMFAQMMLPHHEQAVEMSEMLLTKDGVDQEVRNRAERIVTTQEPEIAHLRAMLEAWGASTTDEETGGTDHGTGGMDHGTGGMMTEADMDQLMSAEGDDAAVLFLEQMTVHHEGAIEMARDQVENGSNPQAVELARDVVEDQESEIQEMETLLERLRSGS